jgi:hypothetical protein
MPVFLSLFNLKKEVIKMLSECTFKGLTVPGLIDRIEKDIDEYANSNDLKILEDISACIEEARRILKRATEKALEMTETTNAERIATIEKKYQDLYGVEKIFKELKGV